jgi:endonuclease/exonuclease/phosphatase family metal-dependent hydrolase
MMAETAVASLASKPVSNISPAVDRDSSRQLRILSYNIQAGIRTRRYSDYVTGSWRQLIPHHQHRDTLRDIANLVGAFDIAGLQEADAGSLRSGFIDQTRFIAEQAGFAFQYHQSNRRVANLAHAGNGLMSRWEPSGLAEHALPGAVPGRGALFSWYELPGITLLTVIVHLSLGQRARARQLGYLAELLRGHPHVMVMGDFNASPQTIAVRDFAATTRLRLLTDQCYTFPSWQPQRCIDHLFISASLQAQHVHVGAQTFSDHLPISTTISW